MKFETSQNCSHRISEEQVSSKMELSTDQPVGHPVARDESVANDGVTLNFIQAAPRCPRRRQRAVSTPNSHSRSSVSNVDEVEWTSLTSGEKKRQYMDRIRLPVNTVDLIQMEWHARGYRFKSCTTSDCTAQASRLTGRAVLFAYIHLRCCRTHLSASRNMAPHG